MLSTQTLEELSALRLEGMAQTLEEQRRQADISQLDFEERLGLLVERQWLWREDRALATRLHCAQLKISAALEDIDYRHPRGLKRAQIDQLRNSDWIRRHHDCLITGPTQRKNILGVRLGPSGLPRRSLRFWPVAALPRLGTTQTARFVSTGASSPAAPKPRRWKRKPLTQYGHLVNQQL